MKLSFPDILHAFCNAYLILLFCVYPFYMKNGYVDIGTHKYYFFFYISVGALLLLLLSGSLPLIRGFSANSLHVTEIFVSLFLVESLITFALSSYKSEALRGTDGWHMGLLTFLLCFGLYLMISHLASVPAKMLIPILSASALVFVLGILDRFSVYLIPLKLRNPSFISTLGNINWFMGYYVVLSPVGIGAFMYEIGDYAYGTSDPAKKPGHGIRMTLLSVYVLIAFMCGLSQGCESVFLFFAALFGGLLFLCGKGIFHMEHWFLLLGFWGIASQGIRLLRVMLPEGYNYETEGFCARVTGNDAAFVIGILALLICYALRNYRKRPELYDRICRHIRRGIFLAIPLCLILWILAGILKTHYHLFPALTNSLFSFNEDFGSGRGKAFQTAFAAFRNMPLKAKLFGIGQDSFAAYVYSVPEIAEGLRAYWPDDRLTNAHCEFLTMLVDQGILGVLLYFGIFVSCLVETLRCLKDKEKDSTMTVLSSLTVFCYLIHNLISFTTVLNLPFLVMIMAMGYIKTEKEKAEVP